MCAVEQNREYLRWDMVRQMVTDPFNRFAKQYDNWFDSSEGRLIFAQETACLYELIGTVEDR